MCGRFNLTASPELIAEEFDLDEPPSLAPRFNIAPSQPVATISLQRATGRRDLVERSWGLVLETPADPRGAEPQGMLFPGLVGMPAGERRHINARSETAARSPAFREAFAHRRCLIPATGFYEWQRAPGSRPQPWLFQRTDGRPFAFAGLWQPAREEGGAASCLILTTEPNDLTREVHERMPAILAPEDYAAWLDPATTSAAQLQPLLRPFSAQAMSAFPVSSAVNNPATDDPSCITPVPRARR
jgi:putative SOS response-associated peptidase YedK